MVVLSPHLIDHYRTMLLLLIFRNSLYTIDIGFMLSFFNSPSLLFAGHGNNCIDHQSGGIISGV